MNLYLENIMFWITSVKNDEKMNKFEKITSKYLNCGFVFSFVFILHLSSCSAEQNHSEQITSGQISQAQQNSIHSLNASNFLPGQEQILAIQARQLSKVQVQFPARVYKLLPNDTRGLPHQKFLLILNNNSTILVAHNTRSAPPVPIQKGDIINIKGEYVWNSKGGLVHWTHHSDNPLHEGGYIEFNGKFYQ